MRVKKSLTMWKTLKEIPRKPVLLLIKSYQLTLSPDHGFFKALFPQGYCKYRPSCSQYGYEMVEKYGVVRGVAMGVWRVLRCNPCSGGGHDPVK